MFSLRVPKRIPRATASLPDKPQTNFAALMLTVLIVLTSSPLAAAQPAPADNKIQTSAAAKETSAPTPTAKKEKKDKTSVTDKKTDDAKPASPLLKIGCLKNGKRIIESISVEEYLRGVVPKEMPPEWSSEALKAQSVAARTFALKNRNRHAAEGYDLCDSTHCQLYVPQSETTATDKAISATTGEVLLFGGEMIDAVFHTDSGGMTEDSENVWGAALPYLRAVQEDVTETKEWSKKISPQDFAKTVGMKKPEKIILSPLVVGKENSDRTKSGRVKSLIVIGDGSRKMFGGTNFRTMFGLPSTLFGISTDGKQIIISGYGAGHGLGLSQYGAKTLAEQGADYRTILHHYYRTVTIMKIY